MERWYPKKLLVSDTGVKSTCDFLLRTFEKNQKFNYAELGIYEGATANFVLNNFPYAKLFLFDYVDTIERISKKFETHSGRISYYPNTSKFCDSYNWNLLKIIREKNIYFDYIFLDGPHTFAIDGLAYFLSDILLNSKGFLDFDDYGWKLRGSSLDPSKVKETDLCYTDEQIDSPQIKFLIDTFVKNNSNYKEVFSNKIFQKII